MFSSVLALSSLVSGRPAHFEKFGHLGKRSSGYEPSKASYKPERSVHHDTFYDCDSYCADLNPSAPSWSYCKYYNDPPVCQYGDQPCSPYQCSGAKHAEHYQDCNEYCVSINTGYPSWSYCKSYLDKPVCQYGDQPCGYGVCGPHADVSYHEPVYESYSDSYSDCDQYCRDLNPNAPQWSYCKSYDDVPVCQFGDQPCGPYECGSHAPQRYDRGSSYVTYDSYDSYGYEDVFDGHSSVSYGESAAVHDSYGDEAEYGYAAQEESYDDGHGKHGFTSSFKSRVSGRGPHSKKGKSKFGGFGRR